MAYTILASNGKILVRKSVWAISDNEMAQPYIKELLATFDESISIAYSSPWPTNLGAEDKDILNSSEDETVEPADSEVPGFELYDYTPEEMDEYMLKEFRLSRAGEMVTARVMKRTRDGNGILTGCRSSNPVLHTRQYNVEFTDGSIDTYTANVVAKNLQL
jgi:hypothetical protein